MISATCNRFEKFTYWDPPPHSAFMPPNPETNGWSTKPPIHEWRIPSQKLNRYVHPEVPIGIHTQPLCPPPPPEAAPLAPSSSHTGFHIEDFCPPRPKTSHLGPGQGCPSGGRHLPSLSPLWEVVRKRVGSPIRDLCPLGFDSPTVNPPLPLSMCEAHVRTQPSFVCVHTLHKPVTQRLGFAGYREPRTVGAGRWGASNPGVGDIFPNLGTGLPFGPRVGACVVVEPPPPNGTNAGQSPVTRYRHLHC